MSKKKKSSKEMTIKQKEEMLLQNTIMSTVVMSLVTLIIGCGACAYLRDHPRDGLVEALSGALEYIQHPGMLFPLDYDIGTVIFIIILIVLVQVMFYFTDKTKIHQDIHTLKGSSEWADVKEIAKKYADFIDKKNYKDHKNNILLSENTYVSLNTNKHFHALNTMIVGTTGSGKSRYFLKPNLLKMNSSYVITDPKGDILKECGEMLRRNGYRVRVFDILNMGNCDTYNPLEYCEKESDIKKIAMAFIKNTSPDGGKEGGGNKDPFWDDSMNAFLCACIAFLTMKPEGSDIPYGQIPEVTGGTCYRPAFANICELTRMANSKWDKNCGIELAEGVKLGDGKNATANASKLAAIFENLRAYEAKIQGCDIEDINKPYCLREWENFRIAPEKTSTTILMTVAVRLDPFNIEQVRNLTSSNSIDLKNFGTGRDALFLIIPPTDRTYNFLVAFLYTQLFDILYRTGAEGSIGSKILKLKNGELVKYFPKEEVDEGIDDKVKAIRHAKAVKQEGAGKAELQEGKITKTVEDCWYDILDSNNNLISRRPTKKDADEYINQLKEAVLQNGKAPRVPYHVRFLMDEFANIGELPEFKDKLATVRGYDISCTVILQSITQLKGMYKDDYEVVDANCPFTIFLGGDENTNNEYISKKIGKATVKGANASVGEKNKVNTGYNVEERDLIKPEELGRMDYSEEIVLIYGEQPIRDKKIDYPALKNYEQTLDWSGDVGLPHFNNFHRQDMSEQAAPLTYKPVIPSAIPNVFEVTDEIFANIMHASTTDEAVEKAFNNLERHSFDISSSVARAL